MIEETSLQEGLCVSLRRSAVAGRKAALTVKVDLGAKEH